MYKELGCDIGDTHEDDYGKSEIVYMFKRRANTEYECVCRAVKYVGKEDNYERLQVEEYKEDCMGNMSWHLTSWDDKDLRDLVLDLLRNSK